MKFFSFIRSRMTFVCNILACNIFICSRLICTLFSFSCANVATAAIQKNLVPDYNDKNTKIIVNNTILAKISDKAITTYDVMKKLDLVFNHSFPDLIDSNAARFQFYITGWQQTLEELINNELVLLDASKKELKLSEAEIREEVEMRYGPNVIINLDKENLTYEDALKIAKEDMILQRMMYYFVKAKAEQKATPLAIKKAYRLYCKQNQAKETWSYNIISIKAIDEKASEKAAQKSLLLFKEKASDPKELESFIKDIEKSYPNCQITISNLYKVTNKEISLAQQKILNSLTKNSYSDIVCQTSKASNKKINRIFYLKDYERKETEPFEEISNKLKENLLNAALIDESQKYFKKLKEEYNVDKNLNIPKDFVPFSIEQALPEQSLPEQSLSDNQSN